MRLKVAPAPRLDARTSTATRFSIILTVISVIKILTILGGPFFAIEHESVKLGPSDVFIGEPGQQVKDLIFSVICKRLVGVSVPQERWAVFHILMGDSFMSGDAVELDLLHSDVLPLFLRIVFSGEFKLHAGRLRGRVELPFLLQLELELGVSLTDFPGKVDRIKFLPYPAF